MPLFSVVVPVYNVEKYINQCVNSILNQTFSDFELILVDDGSPDNCPEICDEFAKQDARVRVIHKKNQGLVSARKAGAEIAKGDYIICVDSDDWVREDCLQIFAKNIEKFNPDMICCGSIWKYSDRDFEFNAELPAGNYNRQQMEEKLFPMLIESEMGVYFTPTVWAKAFKRQLYLDSQLEVNNKIKIGEDHACTKPCIYNSQSIIILDDFLYFYRQNDESMTKARKTFDWDVPMLISEHFEKKIPMDEFDFKKQVDRATVHNLFNVCASQFNRQEKYSVIKKDILKNISIPYYKNAIKNCVYDKKAIKSQLALFSLKHKCIYLMKVYNQAR